MSLTVLLGLATAVARMMLPDDDRGDQALAGDVRSEFPSYDDEDEDNDDGAARSTTTAGTSSTTTTTESTTTTLLAGTNPPTTGTPPPTTTPQTTTTTAPPPDPVINSFSATIEDGCGPNRSRAAISWSTNHATSATLGRVGGEASAVPVDSQRTVACVDDDGETWRLTASGPGGTTTQDLTIDP